MSAVMSVEEVKLSFTCQVIFVWGTIKEFSVFGRGKFPVKVCRKVRGMFELIHLIEVLVVKYKWLLPVQWRSVKLL